MPCRRGRWWQPVSSPLWRRKWEQNFNDIANVYDLNDDHDADDDDDVDHDDGEEEDAYDENALISWW